MTKHAPWQPNADIDTLKARSRIIGDIRHFFSEREVWEVDTPLLAQHPVTDPHLDNLETTFVGPGYAHGCTLYLQTSPEYAMKRLLAAGSGPIYQLGKAFRNDELGRHHNPEFTLLEWYRPSWTRHQLMSEVDALMRLILGTAPAEILTYQQAFERHLNCDPLSASLDQLKACAAHLDLRGVTANESDRDTVLQLLFAVGVEPHIGQQQPCFIDLFPASQAALATIDQHDPRVAERFELYYEGMELANGFHELRCPQLQRQRFEHDNDRRRELGKTERPIDEPLLAALEHGLPDCSGVALGVDRLIMLALNADRIDDVLSFTVERA